VDAAARLVAAGASSPADTLQRLLLLAALPRFKMLLMFLEPPSLAAVRVCIESAAAAAELAEAQASVRVQWGVD